MLLNPPSTPPRLLTWLESWITTNRIASNTEVRLAQLAGDGSTRTFYRLSWLQGTTQETRIVLFDPEWILSKDYPAHQQYLLSCGVSVPKFYEIDPPAGCLVMEDLGDELLQFRLQSDPEKKMSWLRRATQLLAHFHGKTFPVPSNLPVATRRFDTQKYFDELKFTEEHLSQKLLGMSALSPAKQEKLKAFCEKIQKIGPDVFAHRDYHTRNLLVARDNLYMIDFQDARLGSPHYDLASILYDAYVPVSTAERAELLSLYRGELSRYTNLVSKIDWSRIDEDLSWVAFQRVVKAAGSFASFYTRYKKSTHLPYLLPALRSAVELRNAFPQINEAIGDVVRLDEWIPKVEKFQWKKS